MRARAWAGVALHCVQRRLLSLAETAADRFVGARALCAPVLTRLPRSALLAAPAVADKPAAVHPWRWRW